MGWKTGRNIWYKHREGAKIESDRENKQRHKHRNRHGIAKSYLIWRWRLILFSRKIKLSAFKISRDFEGNFRYPVKTSSFLLYCVRTCLSCYTDFPVKLIFSSVLWNYHFYIFEQCAHKLLNRRYHLLYSFIGVYYRSLAVLLSYFAI